MDLILCIETATSVCSVALVGDGSVVSVRESAANNAHSEELTVLIRDIMTENSLRFSELSAVAVSRGPGSYTGLRIGVSAAKGLCYALGIPLVSVDTLQSMAYGMVTGNFHKGSAPVLFCPMIDARRMEVYSAVFDEQNKQVRETRAEIISQHSFLEYPEKTLMVFAGDGAAKCREVISHPNALFPEKAFPSSNDMAAIAAERFSKGLFEDMAYFEPFYLKEFLPGTPKVKGLE
jgi:tRNA threonylcarbamoyladenosine biosynthesis protein TsaB